MAPPTSDGTAIPGRRSERDGTTTEDPLGPASGPGVFRPLPQRQLRRCAARRHSNNPDRSAAPGAGCGAGGNTRRDRAMSDALRTTDRTGDVIPPGESDLVTLARHINAEHDACKSALRSGCQRAIAAGKLLLRAKELLVHGNWIEWQAA